MISVRKVDFKKVLTNHRKNCQREVFGIFDLRNGPGPSHQWFLILFHLDFLLVKMLILLWFLLPEVLLSCEKHHLDKRNQLTEDQPVVDHLGGRGGGQALYLADEDGGHHQHGGQIHTQGCLKEERLEEGGGVGDHHEEEGGEVSGHHLAQDLPLHLYCHLNSLSGTIYIDQPIISDIEKRHFS